MTNLLLSCVLAARLAHADDQKEEFKPSVKPSGTVFFHYMYDMTDGKDGYNEFGLDRAYFRLDGDITKRFSGRITLDADHMSATDATGAPIDTKYRVFVKHAYLEAHEFGLPGVKVRAGVIDTPYAPFYDEMWGRRYITKSFVDSQKLLDTADLGVGAWGKHAKGLVNWAAVVVNGEGYGKLEVDGGKAAQARLTIDPLAPGEKMSLPITGFVSYSGDATDHTPVLTYVGSAGFQIPRLFVYGEYVGRSEDGVSGMGYSATLNPRMPKYAGLVLRYDHWDPDTATSGDDNTKLIAGLEHQFNDKVALAATYERGWVGTATDAPTHGVWVHMLAGF